MSFFFMPYSAARCAIRSVISARASALSGIPDLSIVSAITVPPYFFTSGNTAFMLSSSPFTELISAFPLYILIARSSTAGLDESSWSGVSVTACSADTAFFIVSASSISGRPTFTSRICAPASL